MQFQGFQDSYLSLKKTNPKLFLGFEIISTYLKQLMESKSQFISVYKFGGVYAFTLVMTDVTNLGLNLPFVGKWLILASIDLTYLAGDGTLQVQLTVDGNAVAGVFSFGTTVNVQTLLTPFWEVTTTKVNTAIKIQANKNVAGPGSVINTAGTKLTAIFLG
jgi:hypothetical protein